MTWQVIVTLLLFFLSQSAAAPGDVLFRHEFRGSTFGWTAASDYNAAVVTKFGLGMMGHGIEGSDSSAAPWFFQAPPEILGDRSAAYGGLLRLTYGHRCSAPRAQLTPGYVTFAQGIQRQWAEADGRVFAISRL
jgi:hypothetical protein